MKTVYFVTTNDIKFKKFMKSLPQRIDLRFEQLKVETPEIQAWNNKEVAKFSARWAANKYNKPVIKEDIGMYIEAFNGFPGPYLNHVEKWLNFDGFMSLLQNAPTRKAKYELCVAYCEPNKEPISFSTYVTGSFGFAPKGNAGWIVDKLFIPDNQVNTISELIDSKEFKRNEDHYINLLKAI